MNIELKNIKFSYNDNKILDNFNLTVNEGECVCLVGRSGCGKTTVSRLILGLESVQEGDVLAPEKISCVFQEDRLLPHLNLYKNIVLALSDSQIRTADLLLQRFGLADYKKSKISELSGGMKRRVAIIRAIAFNGDALILDEPFNGLDQKNKEIAAKVIKEFFLDLRKPVLLISHISEDAELLGAKKLFM